MGKNPSEATNAVIKTGRKRNFVPVNTIMDKLFIPVLFNRLNSAIKTMPLSTATPNKAMKPTPALMLKGIPLNAKKKMPPMVDKGMAV